MKKVVPVVKGGVGESHYKYAGLSNSKVSLNPPSEVSAEDKPQNLKLTGNVSRTGTN